MRGYKLMKNFVEKLTIRQGTNVIGTREKWPLRRTPQNILAVAYNYKVYPLYSDHSINLNDPPFSKGECPNIRTSDVVRFADEKDFARNQEPSTLLPDKSWYIEKNQFGNYLVFDGDENLLENVLDALDDAEIPVRRYGQSIRPADDGRKYDWFVRLNLPNSKEECRELVQRAFCIPSGRPERNDDSSGDFISEDVLKDVIGAFQKTIDDDQNRIKDLENNSNAIKAENFKLLDENTKLRRHTGTLELQLKELDIRIQAYKQELSRKKQSPEDARLLQKAEEEIRTLQENEKYLYEEIGKDDKKYKVKIENLEGQLEGKIETISQLESELKESQEYKEKWVKSKRKGYNENFLKSLLETFFPNLQFHEDSYETIIDRFEKHDSLLGALSEISKGEDHYRFEKCEGTPKADVLEYRGDSKGHIATGTSGGDRVRIYLRKDAPKTWVWIDWKKDKKDQKRTIDKFSEMDITTTLLG
ncbi:MAG: hypothetical protein H6867_07515 [Rhodospirillales bacterium]|nr:hypothetical protein [Rhodospirillales bacterium]MCB9995400.1 hypothetical protein [Rhodospirillales bacterium]